MVLSSLKNLNIIQYNVSFFFKNHNHKFETIGAPKKSFELGWVIINSIDFNLFTRQQLTIQRCFTLELKVIVVVVRQCPFEAVQCTV